MKQITRQDFSQKLGLSFASVLVTPWICCTVISYWRYRWSQHPLDLQISDSATVFHAASAAVISIPVAAAFLVPIYVALRVCSRLDAALIGVCVSMLVAPFVFWVLGSCSSFGQWV